MVTIYSTFKKYKWPILSLALAGVAYLEHEMLMNYGRYVDLLEAKIEKLESNPGSSPTYICDCVKIKENYSSLKTAYDKIFEECNSFKPHSEVGSLDTKVLDNH
jgi:hypothetical protein